MHTRPCGSVKREEIHGQAHLRRSRATAGALDSALYTHRTHSSCISTTINSCCCNKSSTRSQPTVRGDEHLILLAGQISLPLAPPWSTHNNAPFLATHSSRPSLVCTTTTTTTARALDEPPTLFTRFYHSPPASTARTIRHLDISAPYCRLAASAKLKR